MPASLLARRLSNSQQTEDQWPTCLPEESALAQPGELHSPCDSARSARPVQLLSATTIFNNSSAGLTCGVVNYEAVKYWATGYSSSTRTNTHQLTRIRTTGRSWMQATTSWTPTTPSTVPDFYCALSHWCLEQDRPLHWTAVSYPNTFDLVFFAIYTCVTCSLTICLYFVRSSRSPQETEPLLDIRDCVARRRRLRKRPSRRRFRPTRRHPEVTYIRGERLGSGSFGTVFQATRSSDQRQVGGHHKTRRRIGFTIELDHAMYPWFFFCLV